MSTEKNKEIVRHFYDEVLNKKNIEAFGNIWASAELIKAGKQLLSRLFAAFPDLHYVIEDLVAEGDKVVVRWKGTGTHKGEWLGIAPTGKTVSIVGISIERFANGKIVAEDEVVDELGMLKSLGVELPQAD